MRLARVRWSRRATGVAAGIAATTVAVGATVVALGFGIDSDDEVSAGQGQIKTALHTVDFQLVNSSSRPEATVPARPTERFSMVGVTWANPRADLSGTIKVRARAVGSGRWSGWQELDTDRHLGPEPGSKEATGRVRGSTDPLWVGPSDGVEVRVVAASGRSSDKLPAGLRLDLVDPGDAPARKPGAAGNGQGTAVVFEPVAHVRQQAMAVAEPTPSEATPIESPSAEPAASEPATSTEPTATASPDPVTSSTPTPTATPTPTPTAIVNPIPAPKPVTRAGWQADESIVKEPPSYGTTVKAVFVHHTAGSNTYNCADSAAIVRAIQAYHVKSNGWNDIGYNFLVDKCGTLFEGRKGGIDQPVIGAHTYGFNTNMTGIAVLGTYISAGVSNTVQNVIAHVAAYRLGKYGNDPAGQVTLVAGVDTGKYKEGTSVVMNRISGHRDGVPTECPGDSLYAQLPTIRKKAAYVTGLTLSGFSGANKFGTTYYTKGTLTASWSVSTPTSLMSRFEILVDGTRVATASAGARSATVTLASGQHTVQVRGVHLRGTTATTPAQTLVVDTIAPKFLRRPQLRFRAGTVTTTAVPVTLSWYAADNTALRSVALVTPQTATFSAKALSWATTATPGTATGWTMRADDWAGNTYSMPTTWTPVLLGETAATRSGTWSSTSSTSYLGGAALTSTATNASLSWTITGRSASFIASRAPGSGQVQIYVDGVKVTTVDLVASTTTHRQAVWTTTWDTSATHTIKIVVVGTSGRPRVTTDGIAYIK